MTTWYVRDRAVCPSNGDGLSYDGAFSGLENVLWSSIRAGDTLQCDGQITGTLTLGTSGAAGQPITITSYDPARPCEIIGQAGAAITIGKTPRSFINIIGPLKVSNPGAALPTIHFGVAGSRDVLINGIECAGGNKSSGIHFRGAGNIRIRNSDIHHAGGNGILFDATTSITAGYLIAEKNRVHDNGSAGIRTNATNWYPQLQSVLLHGNDVFGNGDGIYVVNTIAPQVFLNHTHHNTNPAGGEGYGLAVTSCPDAHLHHNWSEYNRTDGLEVWSGDPLVYGPPYGPAPRAHVHHNLIEYNNGHRASRGIDFHTEFANDAMIYENLVVGHTQEGGIWLQRRSMGGRLFNNVVIGGRRGLVHYDSPGWEVHNNTFLDQSEASLYLAAGPFKADAYDQNHWGSGIKIGKIITAPADVLTLDPTAAIAAIARSRNYFPFIRGDIKAPSLQGTGLAVLLRGIGPARPPFPF